MADMSPDQALDALKGLPEDKQRAVLTRLSPEARKGILEKLHVGHNEDLTTNTVDPKTGKGYGTYEFQDASGTSIQVPYNKVPDAMKLGYKSSQKDRERYAKDKDYADKLDLQAHPRVAPHATLNFQPAPGDTKTPEQRMQEAQQPIQRSDLPEAFDATNVSHVPEFWQKIREGVTSATTPKEKEQWTNFAKRVGQGLFGIADFPVTALGGVADAFSSDPDVSARGVQSLGNLIPPQQAVQRIDEFKQDWKKDKNEALNKLGADVATAFISHKVGKVAGRAMEATKNAIGATSMKDFAREVTGVRPKVMQEMVDKVTTENAQKREAYNAARAKAEHEHQGAMIDFEAQERFKQEQAAHEHEGKMIQHSAEEQAKRRNAVEKHNTEVNKIKAENQKALDEWNEKATRIEEENKAAEHELDMRRKAESELKEKTDKYFADEKAKRFEAKKEENAAWEPWHEKVKGFEVDAAPLKTELDKLEQSNPEVRRAMAQLIPSPEDVEEGSAFAQDRAAIMKSQGMTGDYWKLPPDKRALIDSITQSSGLAPEPVDLNPDESGKIPLEKIHRAKSILGLKLAKGDYEGFIKGEMQQVYKALQRAEFEGSKAAGALDEQVKAAQATKKYHDNFGRVRPERKTKMTERMRKANPEQFKAEQEGKALAGPQEHYPELADQYKEIKALREKVKSMPTEDQLRKRLQQLPDPPETKPYPQFKEPLPTPPPAKNELPAGRPPARNLPEEPLYKTVGWKELSEENKKIYRDFVEKMRSRGVYVLAALPAIKIGLALSRFHVTDAALDLLYTAIAAPVLVGGLNKFADFLLEPKRMEWVTNPTDADMVKLNRYLPEHMQSEVADALQKVVVASKKKNISVSPKILAYISQHRAQSGNNGSQNENIDKELEELTK